ncbi:TetR/AcrR family transcriptional regulator [Sandaracinus amylolyticus]|uniref:Transcriptional regulator, TetR family protein n=1 Tax=Sandaracinus amylolyticus TaxID=927083 RepID=A0A0F6WAP2_9BACT|nr:TetR/AcrR family transcriptional regulator [Sandaracinus amylolyticus]AKF11725.1 Transcriptional regulator, TetR family protein [Sandaracinus amylolyticus]
MSSGRAKKKPTKSEPRSRAESSAETREALIRAGIELFASEGLDAPSLDAICARAGKTRGAFYVHFPDRDAFLAAVMERVGLPFLDVVLGSDDTPPTLTTVVQRFLVAVASGEYPLTAKDGVRPHQLLDACARSEPVRARYVALIESSIARLAAIVARGQDEKTLRDDVRPEDAAAILLAAVVGAQTLMELRASVDLGPAAAAMLAMLRRHPGPQE